MVINKSIKLGMNGRCYDPVAGRFLSPDIIIQDGNNTQCYNKYSYCVNNPLKYNDPSGWSWTTIQAIYHANMVAGAMELRLFMHPFQATEIKSGCSSSFWGNGGSFGPNTIVFQNNQVLQQMAITDIFKFLGAKLGFLKPPEGSSPYNEPSDDPKVYGKEFDNFLDMVNFMFETSSQECDGVELRSFVFEKHEMVDNQVLITGRKFVLLPWLDNDWDQAMPHPEIISSYIDNGYVPVADIHTHNTIEDGLSGFSEQDMLSFRTSQIREFYVIEENKNIYALYRDDIRMYPLRYGIDNFGNSIRYYQGIKINNLPY